MQVGSDKNFFENEPQKFTLVENGSHFSDEEGEITANKKGKDDPADFEQAITACGYGKFHYFVILASIPSCFAQVYFSVTMAYVIPIAECDLRLTNNDKGALNAAVYIGMTIGAFFGGFASDVFGRRKLIVYGHLADFLLGTLSSLAPTFSVLLFLKISAGFIMTAPIASMFSYIAETHNNLYRPRIIMINGGMSAFAQAVQPVFAYYLLPLTFRFEMIPGVLDYTSWRFFLGFCALPSLIAAVSFFFFPESPKFLMSKGRTEEALGSFKKIYALNTGKPADTYPIHSLEVPKRTNNPKSERGFLIIVTNGWRQVQPIFRPPYLNIALVVFAITACTLISMSIRLWVPQLFATLGEAKRLRESSNTTVNDATTICGLIGSVVAVTPSVSDFSDKDHECPPVSDGVYLRSFVISATAALSYIITTPIIGCIGKKNFAKLCFPIAAAMAISINWITSSDVFMALLAVYTALIRNAYSITSTLTVDLFPTAFRSVAVSLALMCGRIASMSGNLLFPVLLSFSCNAVFFSLGGLLVLGSALVWFVSDRTERL